VEVAMAVDDNRHSARKSLPYFDLPRHVRKVLYSDLVRNLLMLHVRSAAALPPEPILNDVGFYISSLRYLLDLYARSGKDGVPVLKPKRRFDENSKLLQQGFLAMLSAKLNEGLGNALGMVFPHVGQTQTQSLTQRTGVPISPRY
jgi:hypothetical protein